MLKARKHRDDRKAQSIKVQPVYSNCWRELMDWPNVRDLSSSIGYATLLAGSCRAQELVVLLGLPRNWTRNKPLAKELLNSRSEGESIGAIAARFGVNKKWLREVARLTGLRYRNARPTRAEIAAAVQLVLRKGASFRSAARNSKISRSALHRYVSEIREARAAEGEDEGLHVKQSREWRCEIHGKLSVYPCVACAALAAAKSR